MVRAVLSAALIALSGPVARAETIRLKNGSEITGKIVAQDDRQIVVALLNGRLVMARSKIVSIDLKPAAPATAPTAAVSIDATAAAPATGTAGSAATQDAPVAEDSCATSTEIPDSWRILQPERSDMEPL